MTSVTPIRFRRLLLNWFDQHGRKHLPWQENKTPYRVWISEIMLQQTQVTTVIPYYLKFMNRFPDLISLANAHLDEVLHLWAGLGYYSRARNLHKAAALIKEKFKGNFPDNFDDIVSLPGIGQSTAGAILAIAFQQPATILDGNVKRVLSRVHGIIDPINERLTEESLWKLAKSYTPTLRTADYTQAIMDLGATVCTRTKPVCISCPFIKLCCAHQQNLTALIPAKKRAKKLPIKPGTMIVIEKDRDFLLIQRPSEGIWGGLWSFPELSGIPNIELLRQFLKEQFNLSIQSFESLPAFRHTFTHYHYDIHPIKIKVNKWPTKTVAKYKQVWYNPTQPLALGLPKPTKLILRMIHESHR